MSEELLAEVKGRRLELTLNRPEKYNALNETLVAALYEQVGRFCDDTSLQLLLLRANGRFFTAGGDVNSKVFPDLSHNSPAQLRNWVKRSDRSLTPLAELIAACEKPTVVAHQGPCLGGGLELSLSFDFRLCSSAASYSLPETRFGSMPGAGGVAYLTRAVGPSWARWLLVAGETVDAPTAERIGLVHKMHSPESFEAEVEAFCERVLAMPPESAAGAKVAIDLCDELGAQAGRTVERLVATSLLFGPEYRTELAKVTERLNRKR